MRAMSCQLKKKKIVAWMSANGAQIAEEEGKVRR